MISFDMMSRSLFLGSCPKSVVDVDRIHSSLKITAVLNLQTDEDFPEWDVDFEAVQNRYAETDIELVRVPILDWNEADLRIHLASAIDTLAGLIEAEHRVYVHCTAGVGRAPATVIGYLALYEDMTVEEAVAFVEQRRRIKPYVAAIEDVVASRVPG